MPYAWWARSLLTAGVVLFCAVPALAAMEQPAGGGSQAAAADQDASPAVSAGPPNAAVIREAQRLLHRLYYDPGAADGVYGTRTRRAVAAYQRDRGLPASGQLTPRTVSSLRQDVAALQPPQAPRENESPDAWESLPWLKPPAESWEPARTPRPEVTVPPPPPAK